MSGSLPASSAQPPSLQNTPSSSRGFLTPGSFAEAQQIARWLAGLGNMVPKDYQGKPDAIIVALQLGSEVGLSPMQSLQNIAVIGNRPSIWGDSMLALVQSSGLLQDIRETWDNASQTATCQVKRGGQSEHISRYSLEKARRSGLLAKKSFAWRDHPERMCQMRARSFALRDVFPDVLMGLGRLPLADEQQVKDITPAAQVLSDVPAGDAKEGHPEPSEPEPALENNPAAQLALEAIRVRLARARSRDTLLALKAEIQQLPNPYFLQGLQTYNERLATLKQAKERTRETLEKHNMPATAQGETFDADTGEILTDEPDESSPES
ncbi:MAG: hypothetical protein ACR2PT_23750 [Endozoicomonas sp.]